MIKFLTDKGKEKIVEDIFAKWDLQCTIIGEVIEEDILEFYMHDELVAKIPASVLVLGGGAPIYQRPYKEPAYLQKINSYNIDDIPEPENLKALAMEITRLPSIASKNYIIEQYDTMVGTANMTTNFPTDAGIVNLKNSEKALAITTDCNSNYVFADPDKGTQIAVAEAARNIVCSGGKPIGLRAVARSGRTGASNFSRSPLIPNRGPPRVSDIPGGTVTSTSLTPGSRLLFPKSTLRSCGSS